jgi:hypothetical protein
MEDTIHYKFVNEVLSQDRNVFVMGIDLPWFDDGESTPIPKPTNVSQRVPVTQDEFKKAMSNNEQVNVFRETIVVSESLEKNTISLKKYIYSKEFVLVKKLKQRKFKIIRRESYSLTINKTTGDFSMYNKKRNRKKDVVFIRKNVSNQNVKNRIASLLSDGDSKKETNDAISMFYQLLGYSANMLTYTSIIGVFFSEDPKDKEHKHSLIIFPFLNYIFKNQINIHSYYLLYPFESLFQKNKKNYRGGNIEHYITDHYKINNKDLINSLLPILVRNNQFVLINKYNVDKVKQSGFITDCRYEFDTINPLILKLLDYYNITINELPSANLKDVFTNVGSENQIHIPTYFFEVLKLYNFKLDDVLANKDHMIYTINELYTFYQFGVKLKISSLNEIKENKDNIFDKIFDALCIARNVTGTFSVNDKFVKRVNRYIPKKVKISFNYNKRIQERSKLFSERHGLTEKQNYDRLFDNTNQSTLIPMQFIDDSDPIKYAIMFNKNYHQSFSRNNSNLNVTGDKYGKLINALNFNKNGILDTLEIKQLYSKQYFENICKEKLQINPSLWVDYIR